MSVPEPQPEPTPSPETKSGGNIPTRVSTHTTPRKKGLLDRIEGWLTR